MPGYTTPFQPQLFGWPDTHLMASTCTQMGFQVPTSVAQLSAQPPPGDGSHSSERPSGAAGSSQNRSTQNPILTLKKTWSSDWCQAERAIPYRQRVAESWQRSVTWQHEVRGWAIQTGNRFDDWILDREKLLEVLDKLDIATTYLNTLATVTQNWEETISEYMQFRRVMHQI